MLFAIVLFSACNETEFLDELPVGISVAKTTSDFRKLLDAVDNERFPHSFSQSTAYLDVMTDDVSVDSTDWASWTFNRLHFQELFTFSDYIWIYNGLGDDPNWKPSYYIASLSSTILEEIAKLTDNETLKKQLIAETKVHRAYAYLSLINTYAKAYDPATASTDLGVPIVTDPSALPSLARNSVQEVYDFLLNDLNEAIEDLPDDVSMFNHRPSKTAAYAVLARAYLYMGNYEKALENANKSLEIHDFLYDLNTQFTEGVPYHENITPISRTQDQEILLHKTTSKFLFSRSYMIIDTTGFDAIYPGYTKTDTIYDNHDLRRTLWFRGWDETTTYKVDNNAYHFVYYGNHPTYRYGLDNTNSDAANNIPLTTGEMYLTRAEANARLGNLGQALADVNSVAEKRFKTGTYIGPNLTDQNAVINAVLEERRRELYGKDLRLFDIKRLRLPVVHYLGQTKISVPADDPRFIHPIWDEYIDINPEIEQNDRSVSGVVIE